MTTKKIDETQKAERLEVVRHSAAHIMAETILLHFPEARFGIGPATSEGFYYDFDLPRSLTPEDLAAIESEMREIIASNSPFLREEVDKEKAHEIFGSQPFKLE
ncbi:MAG: threonine--tRNA ligase, partial [Dehalococcoidia bacterium]